MTPRDDPAAAFEALYRRHYGAVLRYARRRTDAAGAEEVVAETFLVAWQRLDDLPAAPLPWLLVVARNTLANHHRALGRAREKDRQAQAGARLVARDPADALGARDEVIRAFATLPERDREVLALIAWDGLSQRDAARVAGLSGVALRMRLSRARRRLARALQDADVPTPQPTLEHLS